ncbi:hypothetical protein M407DRAFT_31059 [Tulasnella calospora MUT 4182]|uniref:Retrotransposon gag domain-containing protein n=1 Tax=Tulasnella calospora MUT 4182 TaxID=1051891 RepID=A0A0C3Q682_9AGAM|nr:hypothetical protein M407DRAFT_31059 [Tulasnella calospora MUT 4182]
MAQAWGEVILKDVLGLQLKRTAIRELDASEQGKGPVWTYAAELRRIIVDIDWNDQAYVHAYQPGLSYAIKEELVHFDKPKTLEKYIALTLKINNRLTKQRLEKAHDQGHRLHQPYRQQPCHIPPPPAPMRVPTLNPAPKKQFDAPNDFSHSQPVPIQVDRARGGPMSAEEKAR